MILLNKKFIPFYITAVFLIATSIMIVRFTSTHEVKNQETTTTQAQTPVYINGNVPYYPDIPVSSYMKENFTMIDGRIAYTDNSVSYTTGIDVSSFQGDIDWEAVAEDGIDFAIIRAGLRGYGASGNIYEDEKARENLRNAAAAGIQTGVYFYSQAITPEEAAEEAEFVLDIIKDFRIEAPVVFDWENEPDVAMRTDNLDSYTLNLCAIAFCEKIKEAGYTPAVYFNLTDAYTRYDLDKIKDCVFWYAQHEGAAPEFYYSYNIWQYSDNGEVNGIDGRVDLNICFNAG